MGTLLYYALLSFGTNSVILMDICAKIKSLREQHHYSQELMAEKLGIHQTTYGRLEAGLRLPNVKELHIIAELFAIDVAELMKCPPPI